MKIDINAPVYIDANGRDPDTYSKKLHKYHTLLWNKQLPNGEVFNLVPSLSAPYYFKTPLLDNKFIFSSDAIIHTYSRRPSMSKIVNKFSKDEINEFLDLASTAGAYIIFPANKINNQPTINMIRGMHPRIDDRFDLTLECIRLWYLGGDSPLYKHIDRYKEFFELFVNFKGYVDFFLLNDLVDENYEKVNFWLTFVDFSKIKPIPRDEKEYRYYMKKVTKFVNARNKRIIKYINK